MAKKNNQNAAGKRVEDRITVSMSISTKNTLRPFFVEYLQKNNIDPTPRNIRSTAANMAYFAWYDALRKFEFEKDRENR